MVSKVVRIVRVGATAASILLGAAVISGSHAATIGISSIDAGWSDVSGGQNVSNWVGGDGTARLRWGGDVGHGRSGYNFNPTDTPTSVETETAFVIGKFTHFNRPIRSGTAIDSAQLDVTLYFNPNDAGPYQFSFMHDETPNIGGGCCDDIVTISDITTSDTVQIGDLLFTLNILGFSNDNGASFSHIFESREKYKNSALLYAEFVQVVPLPAALPLFLTILCGMGFLRWRARRAQTA